MPIRKEDIDFNKATPDLRQFLIRLVIDEALKNPTITETDITDTEINVIDEWMIKFFTDLRNVLITRYFADNLTGRINSNQVVGVMHRISKFIMDEVAKLPILKNNEAISLLTRQLRHDEIDYSFNMDGSLQEIARMQRFKLTEGQVSIGLFRNKQSPYQYQLVWKFLAN